MVSVKQLEKEIMEQVKTNYDYVVGLRRYFHEYPETAKEEFRTAKRIEEELDALDIPHRRVGETGVYAEITGKLQGEHKKIILRADIDALDIQEEGETGYQSRIPGKMHACGHDAHAAGLLGAARILKANADRFCGTIGFAFQQGEEIGYGARIFVRNGYLAQADRVFGIHVTSAYDVGKVVAVAGPNNASVDWFRIRVQGKSAHVSTPEQGVDALFIASQIVTAVQAIITRKTSPTDSVLIGIGKLTAGTAYNVIAQEASLEGTVRTFSAEIRENTKKQLETVAASIAKAYGGTVTFEWEDFASPLINDKEATAEVAGVITSLFGKDKLVTDRKPSLGGDDFAEFLLQVPGTYAFVGTRNRNRAQTAVPHHNSHFDIDEEALKVSVSLLTAYAMEFLNGEPGGHDFV